MWVGVGEGWDVGWGKVGEKWSWRVWRIKGWVMGVVVRGKLVNLELLNCG